MRSSLTALVLTLVSSSALCVPPQNASSAPSNTVLHSQWTGSGCPVFLTARRTSPTEIVNVSEASRHRGSQRIHLSVDPLGTPGVKDVEITVHASSLKSHFLPASEAVAGRYLDRDFRLSSPSSSDLRERDLWIDGVGSVLSVDLTSITYVDGTTWNRSSSSSCRAIPGNLLLIDSRLP